jgi:gliding motility-associated-like protein
MTKNIKILFANILFLLISIAFNVNATHLRGGEITLKRMPGNALTYEITVTTYTDAVGGINANNNQNNIDAGFYIYNNGVRVAFLEPPMLKRILKVNISRDTEKNVYKELYTFRAPGRYTLGAIFRNRNADVINMTKSDATSFYIETTIEVNTELGLNGTPILLNPAIDFTAAIGQKFIHNPNAFDAEGDSLAYRLIKPRYVPENSTSPKVVNDYKDPTQAPAGGKTEQGNTAATFSMDSLTGDLTWDAPAAKGQYNVAFEILEYRNGILISVTVRDMQIIVKEGKNNRPILEIPREICVQAGEKISANITATDKDNNPMVITSVGPVYKNPDGPAGTIPSQIAAPWATFTTSSTPKEVAKGTFEWQTSCDHIRAKAYEVLFKVEDLPGSTDPKLTDSKTWRIRVVAPAIKGIVGKPKGSGAVQLNWLKYNCPLPGAVIEIYRKLGCTPFEPNNCFGGLPDNLGYKLITTVPVDSTSYIDKALNNNIKYSYRLVVKFAEETGGGSGIASNEVCIEVPLQMPVMTNVSVEKTDKTDGQISVKWTRPLGFLPAAATGPFQYKLYRGEGNGAGTLLKTIATEFAQGVATDTSYTDNALNTTDKVYKYYVELWYTKEGVLTNLDGTLPASAVRLTTTPANLAITLNWAANVPWSNDNQKHIIYRETTPGVFNIIAEVPVKGASTYTFTDDGKDTYAADGVNSISLSVDATYCYKVETIGTYNNAKIKPDLLRNFSQIICDSPKNNIKPCPLSKITVVGPDCEALKNVSCDVTKYENTINWAPATSAGTTCDQTVKGYNIYYARYESDSFTKIATIGLATTTSFTHKDLTSYAGCYYVTAINRFGNESDPQNKVCIDNCPSFLAFPNVITPNNDGKNDDFQPLYCARFIKNVNFLVLNRNGVEVFRTKTTETNDPKIRWKGVNNNGEELPAGIYYYQAEVTFDRLAKNPPKEIVKGYLEIIR